MPGDGKSKLFRQSTGILVLRVKAKETAGKVVGSILGPAFRKEWKLN